MHMKTSGISLISLTITIIAIIILASIVIFNGLSTPEQAQFAKFTSDITSLQETVDQLYGRRFAELASQGSNFKDADVYRWIAAGDGLTSTGITQIPAGLASEFNNVVLPATDSNGNEVIWYAKVISDAEKEIVEIDPENNQLGVALPVYEDKTWKLRLTDGQVMIDPPYEYKNALYASAEDVRSGGAAGSYDGSFDYGVYVNSPKLTEGMIPVYYNGTNWAKADPSNAGEEKWYDYGAKRWANMVTVKSGNYEDASEGTVIPEEDIIGYFVWIPRYAYKINAKEDIDIKFLKGTTNEFQGGVAGEGNTYKVHPVFEDNVDKGGWSSKLSGIWVAKFESSSSETELVPDTGTYTTIKAGGGGVPVTVTGNGKISTTIGNQYGKTGAADEYVTVRPGVTSWRYTGIKTFFTKAKEMAGYHGVEADSHLMKNTEWGAVAYLTQSKYGNKDVWNNNYFEGDMIAANNTRGMNTSYTTQTGMVGTQNNLATDAWAEKISKTYNADGSIDIGYNIINASGEVSNSNYTRTYYPYYHEKGVNGSTTGNVYGIYDLAGGAWEYTSAYVANGGSNQTNNMHADMIGKYANIYPKYKDDDGTGASYTEEMRKANYNMSTLEGDAVRETSTSGVGASSWNSDYSYFPAAYDPFFIRGGGFNYGGGAGVFAFVSNHGGGYHDYGFRVVLVP